MYLTDTYTSQSYTLFVGESKGDKLRVMHAVSMSFGGNDYSHSAANWFSTGSRDDESVTNLIIGDDYTGSIAEVKTWKYPLSASVFKQHILNKESTVGNTLSTYRNDLI